MLFGLFKKSNEETVLVLDIGSASVGAGLVLFKKNQKPEIIYSTRSDIAIQKELDHSRFTVAMVSALSDALNGIISHVSVASTHKKIHIKEVFCVLSSAWSVSSTQNIHFENKEPVKITKNFIEKIITEERRKNVEKMAAGEYADVIRGEVEILDEKIIQTKLNGYETSNPYTKKAREIDITLFTSISSKKVTEYIKEAINKFFYAGEVTFHSFSLVGYSVISDIFRNDLNYLFVDVTGEITDISLIKDGSFIDSVSFPRGKNTIIRKIKSATNSSHDLASSYIRLVEGKEADAELEKKIKPFLEEASLEWMKVYEQALTHLEDTKNIPTKVFLTADEDVSSIFSRSIIRSGGRVVFIGERIVEPFVSPSKDSKIDSFINIATIFFNKIYHLEE